MQYFKTLCKDLTETLVNCILLIIRFGVTCKSLFQMPTPCPRVLAGDNAISKLLLNKQP
jgi:hypothetical protein